MKAGRPCHGIANSFARATSEEGWCPLHYAAANGHVDMITFLLDANADISAQDTVGCTALHVACRYGQAEVVKCLIEAGAEVNTVEDNGYTPLISASEAGHINIVKLLLTAKANPMSQTSDGTTSLICAASNGQAAVVQVLLDTVAEIETRDHLRDSASRSVSENEEFKAINTSKAATTFVNVESKWGTTALHMAASDDHVSSVSLLLENNANVMARSKDEGWLALHYAARYGSPDMVRIILDAMAKFNPQSKEHRTSSNHDSHEGNAEVATSSTDMNAQEDGGQQILPGSVNNADDGMMQLPSQETGVDTGTNFGATALHMAARRGNNEMVRMLLEAKASVNAKDKMRWAALHNAAVNGHTETVEILLAAHADPGGTTDEAGLFTPLHLAANGGHTFTIEKVLEADESIITAQDQSGQTALHIATAKGHIRTVERLLRTEEDVVHIEDQYGFTALHCAVTARRFGIARMIATHIRLNLSPKSSNDIQSALIPAPIDGTSLIDEDSEIDMDVCLEMAKLYPTIPRTHQELGRIYTAKQNYTAAISSFETALDMYLETVEFTGIEVLSHRSTVCDGCEGRPIVVGYRHKCGSCWDFDLCHKCFESSPRPHAEHEFIMIPSEEWLQSRLATAKQSEIRCMETCREAVIC
jgi:ankyrin repeat protein